MKRGQFQPGNQLWKRRKRAGPLPGGKHPKTCAHCKAVRTGDKFDKKAWMKAYGKIRQLRKYGLTEKQYDALLAHQSGRCKICRCLPHGRTSRLAVDHDHKTGKVRGLLCLVCNTRLGFLEKFWGEIHSYLSK